MKRALKILGFALVLVIVALVVVFSILPSLVKDYVEEHDLELIGREVHLKEVKLEWTKFKFGICGLEIKEDDAKSTFVFADSLLVDLKFWPLIKGNLIAEEIKLCNAEFNIIQNDENFNFNTLFKSDNVVSEEEEASEDDPFIFTLRNIRISNTKVNFSNNHGQSAGVDSLQVYVPLINHKLDTIMGDVGFNLLSGGKVHSESLFDLSGSKYNLDLDCQSLSLVLIEPFITEFLQCSGFAGSLSTNLQISGSLEESTEIALAGDVYLNELNLNNPEGERLFSFKELHVGMDSLNVKSNIYNFNSLELDEAYALFELYDEGDNFSRLVISPDSAMAELSGEAVDFTNPFSVLASYIREIAQTYSASNYRLDHLSLKNAELVYNDYTLHNLFRYRLNGLNLSGDSLYSNREFLELNANSGLNGSGKLEASLRTYTENYNNIDLWYRITNTNLSDFSPYTNFFVAHQIDNGELSYENNTKIREGKIVSENNLNFNQFNFAKKSALKAVYSLPVRLAVSLMKDLEGNINLDLPVEGDLNDPEYKVGKVIWSTVKNILLKAVSAPFRLISDMFGGDEKEYKEFKFQHLQRGLSKDLENQLNGLTKVLENKVELNLEFKLISRKYEEAESFAIQKAKLDYLFGGMIEDLDKDQLKALSNLDIRDSLLIAHVNARIDSTNWALPIQKKTMLFSGEESVLQEVDRIANQRISAIRNYLEENSQLNSSRIRFTALPDDSLSTYMSTSVYQIGFWVEE